MQRPLGWSPTEDQKRRLLAFEGYGVEHPDIMFVGLEEYSYPDYERQRNGIWIRCTDSAFTERRVDRHNAHVALDRNRKLQTVPVWNIMAAIVSRLSRSEHETELQALGTRPPQVGTTTWLTELHPLPRHNKNAYRGTYIEEWFDFEGKQDYERRAKTEPGFRILAALRNEPPPQYAFFYGKDARCWARENLTPNELASPFEKELLAPFENEGRSIEIGTTHLGTCVVLTGFYDGQHRATAFFMKDVDTLINKIKTGTKNSALSG